MTINQIQNEIIEEFRLFSDWTEKYEYLIDMGKSLPVIDEDLKTDDYLIKGCQSRVWLEATIDDVGNVEFTADSDAIITKGIIAMLIRVLSGQTPESIAQSDLFFIDTVGLKEHLSLTRANGLSMMVQKMKMYGLAFMAKSDS
jgi:cysteine desulfuration protein SufE